MDGAGPGWNDREGDGRDSTDGRPDALGDAEVVPLASLPVPAFVLDGDAHVVAANDRLAATTGLDHGELAGRAIESLVAEADAGRLVDLIAPATHGEASKATVDIERADGQLVPHRITVGPFRDADGDVAGMIGTAQDVEERVAREAALEEKRARLERFASILSHDLRNPLAVAEGYLHLAREESDAPHLAEVESALDRMGELVEDLMTLAREGAPLDEPSTVDLAGVATDAWSGVSTGDASLVVLDDLGSVQGDRGQLRQLFENLFRNSVEHGSSGGQNARRSGHAVEHVSTSPHQGAREGAVEDGATGADGDAAEDGPEGSRHADRADGPDEELTGSRDPGPAGVDDGGAGSRPARAGAGDFVRGTSGSDESDEAEEAAVGDGVTVTVGPTDDGFYVADDGPGLTADLEDPFRDGVTTKPAGTGLGLSIVERVAAAHGWTVEAGASADGGARFDVRIDDAAQPRRADR